MPPSPALDEDRAEPLGGQGQAALGVVLLEGVEQAGRAAGVGQPVVHVGDQGGEVGDVEQAVAVVVPLDQPDVARRACARSSSRNIAVSTG